MGAARRSALRFGALAFYIIVILVATPQAQQPVSFSGSPTGIVAGPPAMPTDATDIDLLVGRSTILNVGSTIARVSLTVPDVADAMVTAPQQLLIHGKTPGTISLFVWDRAGGIKTYEVNVRRDLKQLGEQLTQLFPGEPISVVGSGKDVVLSGTVTSKYVIDKAKDIAGGYVDKPENVVNLLKQQEGVASNQVMLRVRFAEVSRSALQQLGVNFFTGATGYKDIIARTTTQQFTAPDFTNLNRTADLDNNLTSASGQLSLSDFLNVFIFSNKYNLGAVLKAMQEQGLFQSLAEPNLIASNGKEASFLAGGEYPYPVSQPSSGGNSVTIQFKEFGVRLNFTPTVLGGDLINLKVKPEVSSLDFANGLSIGGFRVPALSTRRTETELELADGQTFAIAGLLNNNVNSTMTKIPGIGDIPILGYLFKSRSYQKQQTELVVMITPTIVRKGSVGVSQSLPNIVEPYMGAPKKVLPSPAPYVGSPKFPVTPTTPGSDPRREPQPQDPAASAAQPTANTTGTNSTAQSMANTPAATATPQASGSTQQTSDDPKPTKSEQKALDEQQAKDRDQAKKDAEAMAKSQVAAAKKAQAEKDHESKLAAEQQKKDAEAAKKAAEAERKKQEEQKKKDKEKALAEAAARLKQAQAEYDKTKGGK